MSRMNVRRAVMMLCVCAILLAILWVQPAPEQQAHAAQGGQKELIPYFFGEAYCRDCHYKKDPKDVRAPQDSLLNRGIEMNIWDAHDKHKNATLVLKGKRAQEMQKNLKYDVAASPLCLSCHGVYIGPEDQKHIDQKTFNEKEREKSGVTCVACHGPYSEWVDEHIKVLKSTWRDHSRKEKEQKWGLKDLWDPATRAEVCSKCHLGNVKEGKVVTHEMYAAGHPPLPGIEIATFCDALPRHWETLTEKIRKRGELKLTDNAGKEMTFRDFYRQKHQFSPGSSYEDNLEQSRMVAISAVGVFKTSMDLIASHAEQHAKKKNADGWPEFAIYDCYACHHDLKSESWRIEVPSSTVPGRPGQRTWSATLLPIVIGFAKDDKKAFSDGLKQLDSALSKTPFGNPDDVGKAARTLVTWSDGLLGKLRDKAVTKAESEMMLKAMFTQAGGRSVDFDSARQLSWGAKALFGELRPKALFDAKEVDLIVPVPSEQKDGPFSALNKSMSLVLPVGQVPIVGKHLTETLDNMGRYEPKHFRDQISKIAGTTKAN